MPEFAGFPAETLSFLVGIGEHNDKAWFDANRAVYDLGYVAAARSFVSAVGPELEKFAPGVRYEPKVNGSISRVNRDTRFSHDKRLYKDHLDLSFWYGEKRGWEQPGYFLRITSDTLWIATGMMHIMPPLLTRYRDAVVDHRSGEALAATIAQVEASGPYQVGFPNRKAIPRGYDRNSPRAPLLLHESLWSHLQLPAESARDPGFAQVVLNAWRQMSPITEWLRAEVTE